MSREESDEALGKAVKNGHDEIVGMLLRNGADVDADDEAL
jgi:hypothetical protein